MTRKRSLLLHGSGVSPIVVKIAAVRSGFLWLDAAVQLTIFHPQSDYSSPRKSSPFPLKVATAQWAVQWEKAKATGQPVCPPFVCLQHDGAAP